MKHRISHRKLRRNQSHRKALLKHLVISLINNERITTSLAKAKEAKPIAEKIVTLGKKGTIAHRRLAYKFLNKKEPLKKLFDEIAPRFYDRPGGYTRIIKLGPRKGDGTKMAILEFVDYEFEPKKTSK